jgi:hypothetical protein
MLLNTAVYWYNPHHSEQILEHHAHLEHFSEEEDCSISDAIPLCNTCKYMIPELQRLRICEALICNKALDFAPPFVCHLAEQHVFACRVVFSGDWELICIFFVCC